jgi:hypothetical protein
MAAEKSDFIIELPDFAAIDARIAAQRAWTAESLIKPDAFAARDAMSPPARFNLLSLPAWLEVARLAGVPHVPARLLHEAPLADFVADEDGAAFAPHDAAIVAGLRPGEMIRMEQVAPGKVKAALSAGREMFDGTVTNRETGEAHLALQFYDDRFYETFLDLGEETIRAYARPIVETRKIEGEFRGQSGAWPEEFRVFVENGRVVGASNYYPQVAMDRDVHSGGMARAVRAAEAMLAEMTARNLGVGNLRYAPDRDEGWSPVDVTLDFLTREDGKILFLEGGPAGLVGAHPCCFLQEGRPFDGDFLRGAAFSVQDPPIPLREILDLVQDHPEP